MRCGRRGRAGVLPAECVDQVFHILLEELVDDAEGVLIGGGIEIEGAAEEIAGGIRQEKLIGGGGVTAHVEIDAADTVGCLDDGLIDGAGLRGMFEGHLKSVVAELVELVAGALAGGGDSFVADIDAGVKLRKIDIYPVGVFG